MVEPAVARRRETFGHAVDKLAPDVGRGELPNLRTGDGFDVAREPLFDPVVRAGDVRKREMGEFMHDNPVAGETCRRRIAADDNAQRCSAIRERRAGAHAVALTRNDQDAHAVDRKSPVVRGHGANRCGHPLDHRGMRQLHCSRRESDDDFRLADEDPRCGQPIESVVGHRPAAEHIGVFLGHRRDRRHRKQRAERDSMEKSDHARNHWRAAEALLAAG